MFLGHRERASRVSALPAEHRDPTGIAVVEGGVGQCCVDLANFFGQPDDHHVEFADTPLERRKLATLFGR